MDDAHARTRVSLREPGFEGELEVEEHDGVRTVRLNGTRPQDDAAVAKAVRADRDRVLEALVERFVAGDADAAPQLLAHLGVVDPR